MRGPNGFIKGKRLQKKLFIQAARFFFDLKQGIYFKFRVCEMPEIIQVVTLLFYKAKFTTVIPEPPKSTCSSLKLRTMGSARKYSRMICRSIPFPLPCKIRS